MPGFAKLTASSPTQPRIVTIGQSASNSSREAGPSRLPRYLRTRAHQRQFVSVHDHHRSRAHKNYHRQSEQLAVIAHRWQSNAELGYMAYDSPADHTERQYGTIHYRSRRQQQDRCDQLHNAAADPSPRLQTQGRKNIDRLFGAGKLEKKRLQQDHGNNPAQRPTCNDKRFAVFHIILCERPETSRPRLFLNNARAVSARFSSD